MLYKRLRNNTKQTLRHGKNELTIDEEPEMTMEQADPRLIAQMVDKVFSIQWCRENLVVPINLEGKESGGGNLVIAIANYTYLATIGEFIKHRAKSIGCTTTYVEKEPKYIEALLDAASKSIIESYSGDQEERDNFHDSDIIDSLKAAEGDQECGIEFDFEDSKDMALAEEIADISSELNGSEIQRASAQILITSGRSNVSDIHIEPCADRYKIRVRRDGIMQDFVTMPRSAGIKLVACLKNMAFMNIAERKQAQVGIIKRIFEGQLIKCACSTAAGFHGEKMVIRLLGDSRSIPGLDILIDNEEIRSRFRAAIGRPDGLIFVSGRTGTGKGTTVSSALREIDNGELNIVTAEDPIEYELGGNIQQFQVDRNVDPTGATLLKQFLWQDPDVIVVGEARYPEQYEIMFDAAQTGHLLFATMYAGSCAEAIRHFQLLEVPAHKLFAAKGCILSQRLLRRVCTQCSKEKPVRDDEAAWLGIPIKEHVMVASCLTKEEKQMRIKDESLCTSCSGSGYKGRVAVYELVELTPGLTDKLSRTGSLEAIQDVLKAEGMNTMRDYARELVRRRVTTIAEAFRVLQD